MSARFAVRPPTAEPLNRSAMPRNVSHREVVASSDCLRRPLVGEGDGLRAFKPRWTGNLALRGRSHPQAAAPRSGGAPEGSGSASTSPSTSPAAPLPPQQNKAQAMTPAKIGPLMATLSVGLAVMLCPRPEALTSNAWNLLAVFLATMAGGRPGRNSPPSPPPLRCLMYWRRSRSHCF